MTASLGGGAPKAAAQAPQYPGRITVDHRVLVKVAEQAAADAVGVNRKDISVDVAETRSGLALRIATPLPVPDLDDNAAIDSGQPLLQRVSDLQHELRDRIGLLTGREITRVNVTITRALISKKRRVQ